MRKMRALALIMVVSVVMSACGKGKEAPEAVAEPEVEEQIEEVAETEDVEEEDIEEETISADEERMVALDFGGCSPDRIFPNGSYVFWDTLYDSDGNVIVEPEAGRDAIMTSNDDTVVLLYYDNGNLVESVVEVYDISGNLLWAYENNSDDPVIIYNASAETGWVEMNFYTEEGTYRQLVDTETDEILCDYCCSSSFFDTGLIFFQSEDYKTILGYDPYARKVKDIIDISGIEREYSNIVPIEDAIIFETLDANFSNFTMYFYDVDGNYYGGVKIPDEKFESIYFDNWLLIDNDDKAVYRIDDLQGEMCELDSLEVIAQAGDNESIIVCGNVKVGDTDSELLKYYDGDGNVLYECSKGTPFANGIAFVVKDGNVLSVNEDFETVAVLDENVDLDTVDVFTGKYEEDILIYRSADADMYYRILPGEE